MALVVQAWNMPTRPLEETKEDWVFGCKYVVMQAEHDILWIFPMEYRHLDVAQDTGGVDKVLSAGFIVPNAQYQMECGGYSETIEEATKSPCRARAEDTQALHSFLYTEDS